MDFFRKINVYRLAVSFFSGFCISFVCFIMAPAAVGNSKPGIFFASAIMLLGVALAVYAEKKAKNAIPLKRPGKRTLTTLAMIAVLLIAATAAGLIVSILISFTAGMLLYFSCGAVQPDKFVHKGVLALYIISEFLGFISGVIISAQFIAG